MQFATGQRRISAQAYIEINVHIEAGSIDEEDFYGNELNPEQAALDKILPKGYTCGFSVDLPAYSS